MGSVPSDAERALFLERADRFRTPAGVTGYADVGALRLNPWSVRNFGYFGRDPAVAIRTVNETVSVANATNRLLGLANPSKLVCDNAKLWDCLLRGGAAGKSSAETAVCMGAHCRRTAP